MVCGGNSPCTRILVLWECEFSLKIYEIADYSGELVRNCITIGRSNREPHFRERLQLFAKCLSASKLREQSKTTIT